MAYRLRRDVEGNIKKRVRKDRLGRSHTDYEAYFGVDPFTGKPVRVTRSNMKKLLGAIFEFYQRHKFGGDAAVRLSALQALDAKNALDVLSSTGVKKSLYEAVVTFVEDLSASMDQKKTALDAYSEFYDSKPEGANKNKTKATVGKWVEYLGGERTLVSLNTKEIFDYLESRYGGHAPKTYNSHLLYIKTFLNWCCREEQGYIQRNPARSLKMKPEPWEEPEYMKPEDVERLFRLLEAHKADRPELLAYAVVNFFCGCRAVEIVRMATEPDAARISLDDATVRIAKAKGFQRGKRPRAFTIHPTAIAWMRSFDFLSALKNVKAQSLGVNGTQKEIYDLARENGVPIFQNCGRHTFITYHVAAYGDPAKTTAIVGTSEKMRADNYCGLASKAEGEAYFAIMPTA